MTWPLVETTDTRCLGMVYQAEEAFLMRWRLSSLRRVNPELHDLLEEQRGLFEQALFGPNDKETEIQAAATVRGWSAATKAMLAVSQPDDAWLYGTDFKTGLVVAIGDHGKPSVDAERVIYLSPDEVAVMVAGMSGVVEAKLAFPAAELRSMTTTQDGGR